MRNDNNNPLTRYFGALDGLRGLAAIGVALFHWLLSFQGYLAVDFFLVLSGFILAHRYLYAGERPSGRAFVLARLARLYPMHFYGLVTYTLVYFLLVKDIPRYPDGTLFTLLQQLTLTHNVGLNIHGQTWNAPGWSISVEFWLNLAFFCYIGRRTSSLHLLLMSVAGLVVIANLTGHLDTTYQNYFQVLNSGLLRGWAAFVLGILAYRAYRVLSGVRIAAWLLMVAQLVSLGLVLFLLFGRQGTLRILDLFAPFVFAALVLLFAFESSLLARLLAKLKWLGTISYSVYLNHLIILMLVDTGLGSLGYSHWTLTPVYLIALIAYSAATYRFIERPAQRLIQKTARTWLRPRPVAT
ncbi:MAG: acyltransferase [Pseudomonadota bacterium]